jgi:ubiquinone/menaquinone biosynthesis C-methylase UbiE
VDHFKNIYATQAAAYHRMIAAEDTDGNLLKALQDITDLSGKSLLDLGSGTGRIPLLMHELAREVVALDLHFPMLREQRNQRDAREANWTILQADMRRLPFASRQFDIVTAGWAIGHFMAWYGKNAKAEIARVLTEMARVCTPGGALVILETLGTGQTQPAAPAESLARYYRWLESDWGFACREIRTDYQFDSVEEAIASTQFFFPDLAPAIRANGWSRLPEWTGMWSKQPAG